MVRTHLLHSHAMPRMQSGDLVIHVHLERLTPAQLHAGLTELLRILGGVKGDPHALSIRFGVVTAATKAREECWRSAIAVVHEQQAGSVDTTAGVAATCPRCLLPSHSASRCCS